MATEEFDDLVSEAPPAKRVRLNTNSPIAPTFDNMDDSHKNTSPPAVSDPNQDVFLQSKLLLPAADPAFGGIPGLGRLGSTPRAVERAAESQLQQNPIGDPKGEFSNKPMDTEMSAVEQVHTTAEPTDSVRLQESGQLDEAEPSCLNDEMSGVEQVHVTAEPTDIPVPQKSEQLGETVTSPQAHMEGIEVTQEQPNALLVTQEENKLPSGLESRPSSDDDGQPLTHALEALLGGLDDLPEPKASDEPNISMAEGTTENEPGVDEHPEWEVDSSPIESSDDSSSDDSSSEEESDDEANAYKLLSPEEQARILMEGDGGSDDEGGASKTKGAGEQLRTKNEVPEEVVPKPDVQITPEMKIEKLGVVETMVENIILIKANTSGEYRALESGSVLCLEDRSVIGVVSETLGRVQQPLYTVRFTNAGEITEAGVSIGTKVFYPEQHANYALTQVLRNYKGSDASNLHDEEVGDEEVEFSDDEAEAEHKRKLKQKKLERRGGKLQQNGGGRGGYGGHPLKQEYAPSNPSGGLSYDDAEDDGPYKPLARPTGFGNSMGHIEAPQEASYAPGQSHRGGRGDFRGRGRGDRGRGRGDRGRGRGGYQNQDRREYSGYSAPPQRPGSSYGSNGSNHSPSQSSAANLKPNNSHAAQQNQYNSQQPMWPPFPPMPGFPNMPSWPMMPNMPVPPPAGMPAGAFINPAFLRGQVGAQGQQQPPQQPKPGEQ